MDIGPPPPRSQLAIAYASFFAMGMGSGLLSVAWPSLRTEFGLGLDATGALFACESIGYILYSIPSGWLVSRVGLGRALAIGALARVMGLLGFAFAPSWGALLAVGMFGGAGTGAIDAGLNTYFAARCRPSHTTRLHASCGLGAVAGPAIMTAMLAADLPWRAGYVIAAMAQALLAAGFVGTIRLWHLSSRAGPEPSGRSAPPQVGIRETLRVPAFWLLGILFFVATGVEVAAGQWPYTLFTEARLVPAAAAGVWTSIYFGCVVVGRILAGAMVERLGGAPTLRAATCGALAGAVLLSLRAPTLLGFAGLALLGLSVGPVFSLLVAQTRRSVGPGLTPHTIGLGMTAAVLGVAGLQGAAGLLAQECGLEAIGPFLVAATFGLSILHELAAWLRQPQPRQSPPTAPGMDSPN